MKNKSYDKEYFKKRDNLDLKIASIIKNLSQKNGLKNILDVGCGTGKLVKYLNKYKFNAVGCDPYFIKKESKTFVKASANKLPFRTNSFDLVTNISVIEHLSKAEASRFLAEAHRVLRANGFIFLVTPNYNSIWRQIQGKNWFGYSDPTHINFYSPGSLAHSLKRAGFKNIKFSFKADNLSFPWFLLISTPFWRLRDSFFISAKK